MADCPGSTEDHCCYLGPLGVCQYLRDDGPTAERRWVCTFMEALGSWDKVHTDSTYQAEIAPVVLSLVGVLCGDWPPSGVTCATCEVIG